MTALVALRITAPDLPRPFRIRLPVAGLCLMFLLPVGVYSIALSGAFMDSGGGFRPALFAAIALCSAELGWQATKFFRKDQQTLA